MMEAPPRIVSEEFVKMLGPFDLKGVRRKIGVLQDWNREEVAIDDQENEQESECRDDYRQGRGVRREL